jgi:hypothetical protein
VSMERRCRFADCLLETDRVRFVERENDGVTKECSPCLCSRCVPTGQAKIIIEKEWDRPRSERRASTQYGGGDSA